MSEKLKNILSEEEQERLANNGITILADDEMELISGGMDNHTSLKKGQSIVTYQSVIRTSMMSCMAGIGGGNGG